MKTASIHEPATGQPGWAGTPRRCVLMRGFLAAALAISGMASTAQAGFVNPGFEEPRFTPGVPDYQIVHENTVPGWRTTASDDQIEFWSDGFGDPARPGNPSIPPYQGAQFAELNAYLIGALYQDALDIPAGVAVGFKFAHRGRLGVENLRVTITDLGANGVTGGGDDTVLFTKAYATGNSAWVPYSSLTEPLIFALGNPVRFQFESLEAGGAGNFLDDCDFGTDVVSTPTALIPLTTGTTQQINTTWFRDAQNGFIGTDGGGVRVTNNGGRTWTPSTTGVPNNIYAIRQVGGVAFLAGANGLICRSPDNGVTWTAQTTGTTTATFRALAFSSSTSGFAVGTGGTICRYNGTTWTSQITNTTVEFTGVSIVGNTAWAVGAGGLICRYDGTSWATVSSGGVTGTFYGVSFLRENLGFAVGAGGLLCRYNGTAWVQVSTGVATTWRSVVVADDSTIVITGDGGVMCQSTDGGLTWKTFRVPTSTGLNSVSVAGGLAFTFGTGGAGFCFTVGQPTGLVTLATGTTRQINATWFSDAQNGLIGTAGGGVQRTINGGRTWTTSTTGITTNINAIRKVGSVAFFAGANGVICRSTDNGVTWTAQTTGTTTQTFRALAFSSATSGFAVGTGGTICVYNGTTWTAQTSGINTELTGVSIVGNTAWAVGVGGVICRYNGTSWATVNSGTTANFTSVSFLSGNVGYAVGAGGVICRYNGTAWVQVNSGVTAIFRSVVVVNDSTIVISGDNGLMCQSTDGGLTWQTFSVGSGGMATVSVAGGQVFTFGTGGAGFCYTISLPSGLVGLPTGTQERINATDFSNAQNGLIGTNGGGVRRTIDGGRTWTNSTTTITSDIYAIRKVGAVAFFAGANGVICRSTDNGVTWTAQTTGTTQCFKALAFSSATSGFAVGTGGTICIYNGTTWTAQTSNTTVELTGVSIVGNTAWAVGAGGVICRYNGTSWTTVNSGVTIPFSSVSFLRANLGYAVGAGGVICRYNGTSWVQVNSGLNIIFRSVFIADENTIVISGDGGLMCQSTDGGLTWQTLSVGSGIMSAVTVAGGQVFTFGTGGAGYCYSISPPGELAGVATGTQEVINAGWFSNAANGWIATDNGGVRRTIDGGLTWTTSNTGVDTDVNAIREVDGVAFLAGANGVICRYNGTTWVPQATGTTEVFGGLAFSSATRGFAVGTGGTICFYNGTTWVRQTTGTTADFTAVSSVGTTTAWAVGTGGIICRYNGTSWATVNSGVTANFYAVAFLREDFGFAVGAGGLICRYNGTSWVAVNSGVTSAFRSVVIVDDRTILISGDGGLVCRSTDGGLTWQTLAVGSSVPLNALAVAGGDVLVFGGGGAGYEFSASPPPTLTSVSPNSGTTAGGTAVTLTGTGFTGATNVTFGGTPATNRTVVNATTITCTTPARAAGTVSVLVTTPGGNNAANTLFTYVASASAGLILSINTSDQTYSLSGFATGSFVQSGEYFTANWRVSGLGGGGPTEILREDNMWSSSTGTPLAGPLKSLNLQVDNQAGGLVWLFLRHSGVGPTTVTGLGVSASYASLSAANKVTFESANGMSLPLLQGSGFGAINAVPPPSSSATLTTAAYTGSNPTLDGGVLYGFPIVSDIQTAPATLTITSTSAGTVLSGISAVVRNNINTGFRTNVNLTLNPGESVVAQTISLTTGQFDDGLRLDYNGLTVLDFDYSNWNIPAVNSMFGGAWTPWTDEGSPTMELDTGGLRLMVTTVSNGTGASAGVLAGSRINVLNYFTCDAYVPNPAQPNFVSGVQIGLYNRNNQVSWAISNATMTATARVIQNNPSPTLTCLSPDTGTIAGGTAVTLTGTGFTGATNVTFGGTPATNRTVVNATTITCTTPARAAGTASVLVTTPLGTNAANALFNYSAALPSATLTTAAYTGSNPTLAGGVLYGFPIVSDTQSSPATLTVTSTSAGTILSGSNAVNGNNTNTGFRTNINLTLNPGEAVVAQTISLTTGQFDDGFRLDYNGLTVLNFDFSNWNVSAVNSIFGGAWTPWTNEGSPVMELDAGGLRLMVTATSNGTGAAAGVLTGQRVNVLNYFTSDAYVRNPASPDFVSGVQIGLYNRNQDTFWSISNATMTATARLIQNNPSGLACLMTGTAQQINTTWFRDAQNGFIGTDGGGVLVTTDGGRTWIPSTTGVPNNIYAIQQVGGVLFIAGANGLICRSTNNGATWTTQPTGTLESFKALAFSSPTRGFAVGTGGTICIYNGTTWVPQTTGTTTAEFTGVSIVGTTAWAVGNGGVICRYNGTSWATVNSGVTDNFYGVSFLRDNLGFAVGANGLLCRYNGTAWQQVPTGVTSAWRSVFVADDTTIVISGDGGLICQSTDGGQTWQTRMVSSSAGLTAVGGAGGQVFAFGTGGAGFAFTVRLPTFQITAFSYNRTARTVDVTFLSEPAVNYTIETSPNGQTWTTLGAVPGAAGTTTTVTGRPLPPPVTDRLLVRVRRP